MELLSLGRRFEELRAGGATHPDQELGLLACDEALQAARLRNYGVGAVLVDPCGEVIGRGQNEAFFPSFRSDRHAEMVVIGAFEASGSNAQSMRGYTLVSSLEPCPMCVARLLIAGVETVKFLACDELGGMATRLHQLPRAWERLGERCEFIVAEVSEDLRQLALDLFLVNLDDLRRRLWSR